MPWQPALRSRSCRAGPQPRFADLWRLSDSPRSTSHRVGFRPRTAPRRNPRDRDHGPAHAVFYAASMETPAGFEAPADSRRRLSSTDARYDEGEPRRRIVAFRSLVHPPPCLEEDIRHGVPDVVVRQAPMAVGPDRLTMGGEQPTEGGTPRR